MLSRDENLPTLGLCELFHVSAFELVEVAYVFEYADEGVFFERLLCGLLKSTNRLFRNSSSQFWWESGAD